MGIGVEVSKKIGKNILSAISSYLKMPILYVIERWLQSATFRISKQLLGIDGENDEIRILNIPSIGGKFEINSIVETDNLIFDFPSHFKESLSSKGFKSNVSGLFAGKDEALSCLRRHLSDLLVGDVDDIINTNIEKVAKIFNDDLERGCQRSNNIMYGIKRIEFEEKDNSYTLYLFKTDYFTFKVVNSIYKNIASEKRDFFRITDLSDIKRIFPFMCCSGVGGILNLDFFGATGAIIGQRSSSVACPKAWHLSFDETYDPRDKMPLKIGGEHPSILMCLKRGLIEELGIDIDGFQYKFDKVCMAVIQTEDRYEIGVYFYVDLILKNKKELYKAISNIAFASDVDNEYDQVCIIPINEILIKYSNPEVKTTQEAPVIWNIFEEIESRRGRIIDSLLKLYHYLNK